jgi:NAD(P)-dependent dehydrogenase (short-subunit alcohol dehydrogenase family)
VLFRSVGNATCELLVKEGNQVVGSVRDSGAIAAGLKVDGVDYRSVDAEDWDSVEALFENLKAEEFPLTGVTLCVGSILLKPAHLTRKEEFDAVISKNLSSAFATVRAASKALSKTGGSIVLVSTAAAQHGLANHEAISAAKAGVEGLARSAAATYAKRQIRVNCVAPGLVRTPLSERITGNPSSLEMSEKMHPLGRIGEAIEVARAITWLLSSDQGWITGQTIGVDGGLSSLRV